MRLKTRDMKHGNCWAYAFPRWSRHPRETYLVVRMSKHGIWPHVFFVNDISELEVEEFKPIKPLHGVLGFFHAIWFHGRVRKGKGEEKDK